MTRVVPSKVASLLIAGVGCTLSLLAALVLHRNIDAYFALMTTLKHTLPAFIFVFGSFISVLAAIIYRIYRVSHARNCALVTSHHRLSSEIKQRTEIETDKEQLKQALMQGQKLQAVGTLAGGVAHDFNNILYAIAGYTEMAHQDTQKETQLHQNLEKILEATHRGQELVARLLAFSRRPTHHKEAVLSVKETVSSILSLIQPTIPAGVNFHLDINRDMSIHGNKTQIHQVLVNLINNAVDAMEGEGTISIKVSPLTLTPQEAIADLHAGDYVKIDITDTGVGIEQHALNRIFEPFFTTKEVGKGTGLGLSIAHAIMKDHHGFISATSTLGRGSTFSLYFPQYQANQG